MEAVELVLSVMLGLLFGSVTTFFVVTYLYRQRIQKVIKEIEDELGRDYRQALDELNTE